MEINRVGVVGAGIMGSGIAQVAAMAGYEVLLHDIKAESLDQGIATIKKSLDRMESKQKISADDARAALDRIEATTELKPFATADLSIEAIVEIADVKTELFTELERLCREDTILSSNPSSIPLTKIAGAIKSPQRVVGLHFFNPVPVMRLVEVIRALQTSDEVCASAEAFCHRIGKDPVTLKDSYGFVGNRVLLPMINEAVNCLAEGIASAEDVDRVMTLGMNHPMGPLALADMIGLDTCLHIMEVLYEGFGDPKYRPSPLLRQMVDAGYLGRKTGRGFHLYEGH